ncbi:hypothetical protein K502DRAFT_324544 [Neoconidiobolus thromboides FSU 785]|nr:hypothetical protein K502DRAFT_324544 [Neoconidiobolus thromboides FSU 785]
MEQQDMSNSKKIGHRCDQCYQSHVKCDKLLPKCSRCLRRKTDCTFIRETVYNKEIDAQYGSYKRQVARKVNVKTEKKFIYVKENKLSLKQLQSKGEIEYQLLKLPKGYNFSYNILGIFNKFQRKLLLENLLNFIQNPSPFFPSKGLNLFITLIEKLNLVSYKPIKLISISKVPEETELNIRPILSQAIVNYFKVINKVFPLFDETRFSFISRSFHLKLAILTGGLLCMEQTKTVKGLIKYFEGEIYSFVKNIPRIKPSLENIQLILVLVGSISYFPWVNSLKEFLLFHCYRISFIIGLNQSSSKLSRKINIERVYTYCMLNFYYNGNLITYGSYAAEPILPLELKKIENDYTYKFSNYKFNFSKNDKEIQQYCFLKLQEFYYILSTLFFDLRLIKEESTRQREDQLKFDNILKKLSFKVLVIKEKYTRILDDLIVKVDSQGLIGFIKEYQYCIIHFFHQVNFYIYTIQFNISKEKKIYEMQEYTTGKNISINTSYHIENILLKCYLAIDSAVMNCHNYTLAFDCPLVSTCLIFMMRFGGNSEENLIYVQKGKEFLHSLLKSPSAMGICEMNLKLLEITSKSLNTIKIE